jgi:hypothetical protein
MSNNPNFLNSKRFSGGHHTEDAKRKISLSRMGQNNSAWKADKVGYGGLHKWIKEHLSRPELCEKCNIIPSRDLANITGIYNRDFLNWKYLCRSCHEMLDRSIDMSNRKCSKCGSTETYIQKHNNRPRWNYSKTGELLCTKCYERNRR